MAEGVLETRRGEIHEPLRESEEQDSQSRRPLRRGEPAHEQPHRREAQESAEADGRVEELPGETVGGPDDQGPERAREGLNPVSDIPAEHVPMEEVVDDPKVEVGVVAHPGCSEEGRGE